MKLSIYKLWIIAMVIIVGCSHQTPNYQQATKIHISWELITNFTGQPEVFEARFIFENNSTLTLKKNWKLFFNMAPRPILPADTPQKAVIKHINGDWYQLVPQANFVLKPGEKIEISYRGTEGVIKETDGPLGPYFVFYDDQGQEQQIVETICNIHPFVRPEQINRNAGDQEPIPTASYRYYNNKNMRLLPADALLKIIPSPVSIKLQSGTTTLNEKWSVIHEKKLQTEAAYLTDKIRDITGWNFQKANPAATTKQIILKTSKLSVNGIDHEAYTLTIGADKIEITGSDAAGVFYGIQSLLAMIPITAYQHHASSITFERTFIQDAPRFQYRGLQTDLGRNFQSKETILRILDLMSFYKLNRYLFYMTEDEGWRLEIPGLPELTDIGAQRQHTRDYHDNVLHPAYGSGPHAYEKGHYGSGYFTISDFIELLKYARDRHIKVIPEVNLPAHARCAIKPMEARYQKLMSEGKEAEANEYRLLDPNDHSMYESAQGYHDNTVSVSLASTYHFYKKVIDEIAMMYQEAGLDLDEIHVGGDEVPDGAWSDAPAEKALLQKYPEYEQTKNLQAFFLKTLIDTLKNDHYKIDGWEEVALLKNEHGLYEPNPAFLNKNVVPYIWNNLFGHQDQAYKMANMGYDVVLCPVSNFYFDLAYDKDPKEPGLYWAGFVRTRDAWTFAPYDMFKTTFQTANGRLIDQDAEFSDMERLKPEAKKHILGVEAQIWSETIKGRSMMEYYMLPKLIGFAESAWAKERDWETIENAKIRQKSMNEQWNVFANTLAQRELPRLSYLNGSYNYRIPLPGAIILNEQLMANSEFPGLALRYTTDDSDPDLGSPLYEAPVKVSGNVKIRAFDASGKGSRVVTLP